MSRPFKDLAPVPLDPVFGLARAAKAAPEPKADLVIGAYRDQNGLPYPLKVVRKAERRIVDMGLDKEYPPMTGLLNFVEEAVKLAYGNTVPLERIAASQGLSGTGSLSLGATLLRQVVPEDTPVYVSNPTWPNHVSIFGIVGHKNIREYRYYSPSTHELDFVGLIEDLNVAPQGSIIVLHACAHNPTGVDPSKDQWATIADVFVERKLIPFFDSAYQGFASGSLDEDAYAIRHFAKRGMEMLLAQSFSKNMGLYAERVGVISAVVSDASRKEAVRSRLEVIARSYYSTPPVHGARIAHLVMSDKELRAEWEQELKEMVNRVRSMRQGVYEGLMKLGTPGTWEHIINQKGMFSYMGLSRPQCERLCEKRVFVLPVGRANLAALTPSTMDFLVKSIDDVVRHVRNK
ncbi:aspartate aminotransferase [Trypanosoma equiperdum]|uniref:Aspartate aminotransferase n=1 Tax=Trypanosoma equiperdum TaxID=5694 RepID=A0A1G4IFV8_TRYEQ|nr:aspartate aminotransferase [Trypanosoma equiperdum]